MRIVALPAARQVASRSGRAQRAFVGADKCTIGDLLPRPCLILCTQFKFDDYNFDDCLKDSKLGRILLLLSRHPKETEENQRTAQQLICTLIVSFCAKLTAAADRWTGHLWGTKDIQAVQAPVREVELQSVGQKYAQGASFVPWTHALG